MKAEDRRKLIDRVLTLDGITDDERAALLGLLRESKTYGLVWEEKPEDVEERLREELPVLTEVSDRAIISENPDAPNHIIIEGDNLEALSTLAYTHAGKIDVIYIDPPYNIIPGTKTLSITTPTLTPRTATATRNGCRLCRNVSE